MKKNIVLAVLLSIIIPSFAFALSIAPPNLPGDVDPNGPVSSCVNITNNLRYKTRDANVNGDVSTLQDFLQSQNYLNSEPTGYFGILTLKAVKDFQSANGISPTGFVGSLTIAKIKSISCGLTTNTPTDIPIIPQRPEPCPKGAIYSLENGKPCVTTVEPYVYYEINGVKSDGGDKVIKVNYGEPANISWKSNGEYCEGGTYNSSSSWNGKKSASGSEIVKDLSLGKHIMIIICESSKYGSYPGFHNYAKDDRLAVEVLNNSPVSTCTTSGFDSRTGFRCGCSSVNGYSSTTGVSCGTDTNFPPGCFSTSGFSVTTGEYCDGSHPPTSIATKLKITIPSATIGYDQNYVRDGGLYYQVTRGQTYAVVYTTPVSNDLIGVMPGDYYVYVNDTYIGKTSKYDIKNSINWTVPMDLKTNSPTLIQFRINKEGITDGGNVVGQSPRITLTEDIIIPKILPTACTSFPCFFDGKAINNSWATIDGSPSNVSAIYPYEFTLPSNTSVKMTLRSNVWPADLNGTNTMLVEVDNTGVFKQTKIYNQYITDEQTDNTINVIQLGQLLAGKHYIKIYASPDPKHFMFDWFKLESSNLVPGCTSTSGFSVTTGEYCDGSHPPAPVKIGDVNGDGVINCADTQMVADYSVGLINLTSTSLKAADVNGDGMVNIIDAQQIARLNNLSCGTVVPMTPAQIDAQIKTYMSTARAQAEIYWDTHRSYAGVCSDNKDGVYSLITNAAKLLSPDNIIGATWTSFVYSATGAGLSSVCHDSSNTWAAITSLKQPTIANAGICVDSTGVSREATSLTANTVACPQQIINIPTAWIHANDKDVAMINSGQTAQISWGSTNATDCYGNFTGSDGSTHLSPSGSITTIPLTQTTSYTIACTNSTGKYSNDVSAMVNVINVTAPVTIGDVNNDGVINCADTQMVADYSVGLINLTSTSLKAADVNGDGMVNIIDAQQIARNYGLSCGTAFLPTSNMAASALNAFDSASSANSNTTSSIVGLKIGDKIQVKVAGNLNVRADAGVTSKSLGGQINGTTGFIIDGPKAIDGQNWWKVDYSYAQDGWSTENFLSKVQ